MGSGGTALGIIGIILAAGAIGFAFFVWNGQNATNSDLNSDLDDLTDALNNLIEFTNMTGFTNMTDEFNNLTYEFNNLTYEFNNLTYEFNNLESELANLESIFYNMTRTVVVGIWEELDDNLDFAPHNTQGNWLFEFGDNTWNNTDYISVSNTNTRITLLKPGWYRIHLSVLIADIGPSNRYWIGILKDGVTEFYIYRYETSATMDAILHYIDSSAFVYSDGTNYIELNGWSNTDDFNCGGSEIFDQFKIEYVAI